jgi:hypothetical protein
MVFINYYRLSSTMFQDNSSKRSVDLDYVGIQLANKQNSIKMGSDSKSSVRLPLMNHENYEKVSVPDLIIDFGEDENDEEENLGNNTKPCLTNMDFQSLPDLNRLEDLDLPSIPIFKTGKSDKQEKIHSRSNGLKKKTQPIEEEKYPILPGIKESTIIDISSESSDQEDNVSQESVDKWSTNKQSHYDQTQVEKKDKLKDSFEWNNFLVRRACFRGISVYYKK